MKSLRKRQPAESLETLLDELQQRGVELPPPTGPAGADAKQQQPQQHQQQQPKLLDYASESDSDSYVPNCQQTHWRRDDSDAESVDSDQDDPLRLVLRRLGISGWRCRQLILWCRLEPVADTPACTRRRRWCC